MLLEPTRFPFVELLESNWQAVRDEQDGLEADDFMPWFDYGSYNEGWDVYGLVATVHHARDRIDPAVRRRCPRTMALLDQVPGLQLAAFSKLMPGTVVFPHEDLDTGTVRCHLPLRVPVGARFQVGDREVNWIEGRCLVFDNRRTHAAANESGEPRVVLLLDVEREVFQIED